MQVFYSLNEQDTYGVAAGLAEKLHTGDIVLLRGDLGAGKSVFARGLARAYGIEGHITSPTFTTMQQYAGARGNFYHFDLYRMDDPEQLFETGLNEYIGTDGLAVIEWPENACLDPAGAYTVRVERVDMAELPDDKKADAAAKAQTDDDMAELDDGYARRITIIFPGDDEQ